MCTNEQDKIVHEKLVWDWQFLSEYLMSYRNMKDLIWFPEKMCTSAEPAQKLKSSFCIQSAKKNFISFQAT